MAGTYYFWIALILLAAGSQCRRWERDSESTFLRVTSIVAPPYLQLVQNSSNFRGNDKYEGFIPDLLKEIGRRASFTYQIYLVKDGKYGIKNEENQWSGMIGELIRGEADLSAAPLTRTRKREEVVDFSYTFMTAPLTMLVPKQSDYETVVDLLNSSYPEISYGVVAGRSTAKSFGSSTQPPYSLVWANMASKNGMLVDSSEEGLERVKKGDYIFIGESPTMEYLSTLSCDVRTTETFFIGEEPRNYALAMPSGHPFLKNINKVLKQLEDDMVLEKLHNKWWSPPECSASTTLTFSAALVFMCALVSFF